MALRTSNDPQYWRDRAEEARAIAVQMMDAHMSENNANELAELGQDIITFDASDDSLERAALVTDGQAITIGHCTHWWHCSWPLQLRERSRDFRERRLLHVCVGAKPDM